MLLLVSCGQANTPSSPLPTATTGPVTLHIDAVSYHTNDTITVTLNNQDTQTIYFADHQTNCTVILVQQQLNGKWENMDNCGLGSLSTWQTLDAGQHLIVKLSPASDSQWSAGLYRVTVRYRPDRNFNSLVTIYSAGFQIV